MAVVYGTTIENMNIICDKAKNKKDGVYTFRGVAYSVMGGSLKYVAYMGNVYVMYGHFVVKMSEYDEQETSGIKYLKDRYFLSTKECI